MLEMEWVTEEDSGQSLKMAHRQMKAEEEAAKPEEEDAPRCAKLGLLKRLHRNINNRDSGRRARSFLVCTTTPSGKDELDQ